MESVNAHLSLIKQKFPPYSETIQDLYDTDPDFQSLCADYFLCVKFLMEYPGESGDKRSVLKEYVDVSKVLEKDLYDFITQDLS